MSCFTGTIYVTNDINIVQSNINTSKVLMVTNEPILEGHPNRVGATILLPPAQAIIADADDDMQTFQTLYYQYLISDEVTEFFSLIFYILHIGVNVLIYIPKEDMKSLDYVGFLLGFFNNNYGLQVGNEQIPFAFNPQFEGMIADMLYLNDLIDSKDVLMNFSVLTISNESIMKLYEDIRPYTQIQSIDQIRTYFNAYQMQIIQKNRFIEKVVSRVKDV